MYYIHGVLNFRLSLERHDYIPKVRPPYSVEMIRHALHLRYTSLQAYKMLFEKFPLPSLSLLNKIQQGGVDAVKAVNLVREFRQTVF